MSQPSDMPPYTSALDTVPPTSSPIRRIGQIMLIAGNLLMVATFFMPWLDLETSFCTSGSRCRYDYGPWTLIQPGIQSLPFLSLTNPFLIILPCALIIVACSVVLLKSNASRTPGCAMGGLFALCFACFLITLVIMGVFHVELALSYPYFQTEVAFGAWLAQASFACILAGAVILWPR
jgi:hypothetical protein